VDLSHYQYAHGLAGFDPGRSFILKNLDNGLAKEEENVPQNRPGPEILKLNPQHCFAQRDPQILKRVQVRVRQDVLGEWGVK
jgi:hypothetical protein